MNFESVTNSKVYVHFVIAGHNHKQAKQSENRIKSLKKLKTLKYFILYTQQVQEKIWKSI